VFFSDVSYFLIGERGSHVVRVSTRLLKAISVVFCEICSEIRTFTGVRLQLGNALLEFGHPLHDASLPSSSVARASGPTPTPLHRIRGRRGADLATIAFRCSLVAVISTTRALPFVTRVRAFASSC
jgi:hypothetical protein